MPGDSPGGAVRVLLPVQAGRGHGGDDQMIHLDLCSGIGGFALAARWHGVTTGDDSNNVTRESGEFQSLTRSVRVAESGGKLNPDWVTRMMGYPDGWLDIGTETGSVESVARPPDSPTGPRS